MKFFLVFVSRIVVFSLLFFSGFWARAQELSLGLQSDIAEVDFADLNQLRTQSAIGDTPVDSKKVSEKILQLEDSLKSEDFALEDKDKDSLPDDYERLYFGDAAENSVVKVQSRMRVMSARGEFDDMPRLQILSNGTKRADSDGDGLSDVLEFKEGTHPAFRDSDRDGVDDGVEIVLETNPKKIDTDSDGFPDSVEVAEKTDPADPQSYPEDTNNNQVADSYEQKYNLTYTDQEKPSFKDSDHDGLSDKYEYQLGTNPTSNDSDGDSLFDFEEVLDFSSNPLVADELKYIPLKITNWAFQEKTPDNTPTFKGIAYKDVKLELYIDDNSGHAQMIGEAQVSDNGRFIVSPTDAIANGLYAFWVQEMDSEDRVLRKSPRVQLTIDSKLDLPTPRLEAFEGKKIGPEIKDVRLITVNNQPVITGRVFGGSRVYAYWQSLLLSSSILVDYDGQYFEINAPLPLEANTAHEVSLYALKLEDNQRSQDVSLAFEIKQESEVESVWDKSWVWPAGLLLFGAFIFTIFWKVKKSIT